MGENASRDTVLPLSATGKFTFFVHKFSLFTSFPHLPQLEPRGGTRPERPRGISKGLGQQQQQSVQQCSGFGLVTKGRKEKEETIVLLAKEKVVMIQSRGRVKEFCTRSKLCNVQYNTTL